MKTRFTQAALHDLSRIARWIAADRPNASKAVASRLRAKCMGLAHHPRAYPLLPNQEERGVRRVPHERWAICYSINDDGVLIIRVLDSAQDATDLF